LRENVYRNDKGQGIPISPDRRRQEIIPFLTAYKINSARLCRCDHGLVIADVEPEVARSECVVVLLSNEHDPDLSREIAEHSRLDLLVRPLVRELVFHSLFLAYGRWLSRLVYTQGYLGRYVVEGGPGGPSALSERNTVRTR
jgi:hypothetical protein